MAVTVNIYYSGENGNAKRFAEEMMASGIVSDIRAEAGNLRYEYFFPMEDEETVLLIDSWKDQQSIDLHHASPMMAQIIKLREKYDLLYTSSRIRKSQQERERRSPSCTTERLFPSWEAPALFSGDSCPESNTRASGPW